MGAGVNIFRIGILLYSPYLNIVNVLISGVVFAIFQYFIFGRLVRKHTDRIHGYIDERQFFLKFFDTKSFVIMIIMIFGGIGIRSFHLASDKFIAVFYTGLGAALLLAGVLFCCNYVKAILVAKHNLM